MSLSSWHRGPLGEEFEGFSGIRSDGDGWKRGFANWTAVLQTRAKGMKESAFLEDISVSQRNSLVILCEWWNCDYDDQAAMHGLKVAIEAHASAPNEAKRVPEDLDLTTSEYRATLFDLLLYEFFFYGKSTAAPIQIRRKRAAKIAACQRLARAAYISHDENATKRFPTPASSLGNALRPDDVLKCPSERPVGAVIEPYPWLPRKNTDDRPYYLWDLRDRRTVVVDELASVPKYTTVSHTWGRWRIEGPGAIIPGVPWRVPQTKKFSVEKLPHILAHNASLFAPARFI